MSIGGWVSKHWIQIGSLAGVVSAAAAVAALVYWEERPQMSAGVTANSQVVSGSGNTGNVNNTGSGTVVTGGVAAGAIVGDGNVVTNNQFDREEQKRLDVANALRLGNVSCMNDVVFFKELAPRGFVGLVPTRIEQYVDARDLFEVAGGDAYSKLSLVFQNKVFPAFSVLQTDAMMNSMFGAEAARATDRQVEDASRRQPDVIRTEEDAAAASELLAARIQQDMLKQLQGADFAGAISAAVPAAMPGATFDTEGTNKAVAAGQSPIEARKDTFIREFTAFCGMMLEVAESI